MRPTYLIYDDNCSFCREKAEKLKNRPELMNIKLVGKTEAGLFLDPETVQNCDFEREIHLIEPDGTIFRGGDFLHRLFSAYSPRSIKYRFLALPIWKPFLRVGYKLVAKFRHFLA